MHKIAARQWFLQALMSMSVMGFVACKQSSPPPDADTSLRDLLLEKPISPENLPTQPLQGPGWTLVLPAGADWTKTQQEHSWQVKDASRDITVVVQYQDNVPVGQITRTIFPTDPEPELTPRQLQALSEEERNQRELQTLLQKTQIPFFLNPTLLNESIRKYVMGIVTMVKRQDPNCQLRYWTLGTIHHLPAVRFHFISSLSTLLSNETEALPFAMTHVVYSYVLFLKNQALGIWVKGPSLHQPEIQRWADVMAASVVPLPPKD